MINRLSHLRHAGVVLIGLLALAGCVSKDEPPPRQTASSSSSVAASSSSSSANSSVWVKGEFPPAENHFNLCENPRSGIAPYNSQPYPDKQGSWLDENNYLRSMSNDVYLWYDEIDDRNPALYADTQAYFHLLKTTELSPTGKDKDRFHWHADTDEYRLQQESGVSAGYGVRWTILNATPPREVAVAYTEPNSPAADAGIKRGTRVLKIDGVDLVNDNNQSELLNAGLFPAELGETHEFVIQDLDADEPRTVSLTSTEITMATVQSTKVIDTPATGKVGYMVFNAYISPAEAALKETFEHFETEGVNELILDMRYNGGGYLAIAAQLGYMIAGTNTAGKDFETMEFNDKHPTHDPFTGEPLDPTPFYNQTLGFSSVAAGQALPSLNLDRVYVLAGSGTCSASEAVINGLRGIDVEVILIGSTTCGKPYGAYILDNCGTSYFTTQFRGVNAKNWGDYSDGFTPGDADSSNPAELPGCIVNDDFDHLLGDPEEARLAAALHHLQQGSCPDATSAKTTRAERQQKARRATESEGVIYHPPGMGDKIMRRLP